jgi:DnaJ-class molecular chaperone
VPFVIFPNVILRESNMVTPNDTNLERKCPWCKGSGRIAPAFDCGPCLGTGNAGGRSIEQTSAELSRRHRSSDAHEYKRGAGLVVLVIVVRLE